MKKVTIYIFSILLLLLIAGCNNSESSLSESDNNHFILEQYKEIRNMGGFIPEKIKFDMYTTNWFYKLNSILNNGNYDDQNTLKIFLSDFDVLDTSNYEKYNSSMVPNIIYTLSFLELTSQLNISIEDKTKKEIINNLLSRQDPNTGYFMSDNEDMNDALFTTFSIEILNILNEEVLYGDKLIQTIKKENKSDWYLIQVLLLLNKDIPEDLVEKAKNQILENEAIDNIVKLNLAYTMKKNIDYVSPNEINIPWEQFTEPKTLYQISYLVNGDFPFEMKEEIINLMNNRKSEVGWGTASELSIFYTYLGISILKNSNSLEQINQTKVNSFFSTKVNDFHYISTVEKERLNYNDLVDLQSIIKSLSGSDYLKKELKEILEIQVKLYNNEKFTPSIGALIESVIISNNESLLSQFNYINTELSDIETLDDLYSYTLQSYNTGKISEEKKTEILKRLELFNTGKDFFYSSELDKGSSIEGLYQAYTITNLLRETLDRLH